MPSKFTGFWKSLIWTTYAQYTYYNLKPHYHDRTPSSRIVRIAPVSNPIELLSDDEPTWAEAKIKRPNPLARWVSRLCCRGCCACMCTAPDQGIWGNIWLIWLWNGCVECGHRFRIESHRIGLNWIGLDRFKSNRIRSDRPCYRCRLCPVAARDRAPFHFRFRF